MQLRPVLRVAPIVVILILAIALAGLVAGSPAHELAASHSTVAPTTAAKAASPAPTSPKIVAPGPAAEARLQSLIKSEHVDTQKIYPPNLLYAPKFHNGMIVGPEYPQAPEPAGIGDYGVDNSTGTPVSYVVNTVGYEASVTINSVSPYYLSTGVAGGFTSQLNAVLNDVTLHGISGYTFWNQNVFFYDAIGQTMFIENNIWNFSSPSACQPVNTFYYTAGYTNGSDDPSICYYAAGTADIPVQTPFTVQFYMNATTLALGGDDFTEVNFAYNLVNASTDATISAAQYDRVLFNNSGFPGAIPQAKYHIDGTNITPTGFIPYDAEVMLGGPGGGSTATFNELNGTMSLQHLNPAGTEYVPERSAWSSGSETGETAVGVAEYYDAQNVVHLGGGPEFIQPMWNSSPTSVPGAATLTGTVGPSNAWGFASPGASYNLATSAWGPLPTTGPYTWNLEAGTYSAKFMLSNFDPVTYSGLALTTAHATTQDVALVADPSTGIYTPLYAWSASQLANISSGGTGTLADPYLISDNEYGPLSDEFATFNDYGFQSYPGISIGDTSAYAVIAYPASFQVDYWGPYLDAAVNFFDTPTSNSLPIWLFGTSHVSIVNGTEQGWFGEYQDGFAYANVQMWNSTGDLITGVTFSTVSDAIFDYGGTGNTIAGNVFVDSYLAGGPYMAALAAPYGLIGVPTALSQNEGGDLIFNNYFDTDWTAYESNYNVFDGIWPTVPDAYTNDWNLASPVPSTSAMVVNNITLTGSVAGSSTVCGNYWNNYVPGSVLPYDNFGWIITGGDACPVGMPVASGSGTAVFSETGLPAGTAWSVTVGVTPVPSSTGSASISEAAGSYAYTVGTVAGYAATPSSGNVAVTSGGTTVVDIAFAGTNGWVAGTVAPGSASVWVDGVAVTVTSGAFNVSATAGVHSVEATGTGYVSYYNNVTVPGGATTHVTIVLGATGTTKTTTNSGLSSTDLYAIVGAIIVLAIAILIAAALLRGRKQPPAQAWSAQTGQPPSNPPSSGT